MKECRAPDACLVIARRLSPCDDAIVMIGETVPTGTLPADVAPRTQDVRPLSLLGMALALGAAIFVVYAFYVSKGPYGSDWQTFYDAAVRLRQGRRVYTVAAGFFNPPPVLLPLQLFILVPYIPSRVVWGALSTIMLLASAWLTADAQGRRPDAHTRALAAWWILCSVPTMLLVPLTGNFSALVLFSMALSLWLFARGKEGWAGAVLAITLVKPQLAFLTLPLLLYKRRWRAALGYLAVVCGAVALSLPVVGISAYREYLAVQRSVAGWTSNNDALQLDVPGMHGMFLQRWPHSTAAEIGATACSLVLVLALGWYWRGSWRPGSTRFAAGWALLVLCTLLVSSFAHSYDLVLLILPMVTIDAQASSGIRRWAALVLVALYVAPDLVLLFRQHFLVPVMLGACFLLWRMSPFT